VPGGARIRDEVGLLLGGNRPSLTARPATTQPRAGPSAGRTGAGTHQLWESPPAAGSMTWLADLMRSAQQTALEAVGEGHQCLDQRAPTSRPSMPAVGQSQTHRDPRRNSHQLRLRRRLGWGWLIRSMNPGLPCPSTHRDGVSQSNEKPKAAHSQCHRDGGKTTASSSSTTAIKASSTTKLFSRSANHQRRRNGWRTLLNLITHRL